MQPQFLTHISKEKKNKDVTSNKKETNNTEVKSNKGTSSNKCLLFQTETLLMLSTTAFMFEKKSFFTSRENAIKLCALSVHVKVFPSVPSCIICCLIVCICYHVYTLYFSQYKLALFVAEMDLCICAARYFSTDRELFRDLKITATDPGLQGVQLFVLYVFVCSFFLSVHLVFEYFVVHLLEFEEEESDRY